MRSVLALGLLAMLWNAAADAATVHRGHTHQRVIMRPNVIMPPHRDVVRPWSGFPDWRSIPPEENRNLDPSTRGSG